LDLNKRAKEDKLLYTIADVIYEMKDKQIQKRYQEPVNEFVRKVLGRYRDKVDSIILFGSVARGEAKDELSNLN
jgi:predicted nucleotidyltransferase